MVVSLCTPHLVI